LSTKHYYTKANASIRKAPGIHAEAMYQGFKSEHISRLVEDFFKFRSFVYNPSGFNLDVDLSAFN